MSKYAPVYKCLICGRIARLAEEREPLELEQHQAEVLAQGLVDCTNKKPRAREKVPYAGYHDCWGNGKNVGASVFAGFVMVGENEKEGKENV